MPTPPQGAILSWRDLPFTPVTIHAQNTYAPTVIAEVSRQAGIPMEIDPDIPEITPPQTVEESSASGIAHWRHVTLHIDNQPFWSVLCDIGRQAGGAVTGRLVAITEPWPEQIARGPFLLSFEALPQEPPNFPFETRLYIHCDWEPQVPVICYDPVSDTKVFDQNGGSLLLPSSGPPSTLASYKMNLEELPRERCSGSPNEFIEPVYLRVPPASRMAHVTGIVRLWLASKWETIEVPFPSRVEDPPGTAFLPDGNRITTSYVQGTSDKAIQHHYILPAFSVTLDHAAPGKRLIYPHLLSAAKIHLLDARGRPWTAISTESVSTLWTEHEATMDREFHAAGDVGPPVKAVIRLPSRWYEVDIPFDFHDFPFERP